MKKREVIPIPYEDYDGTESAQDMRSGLLNELRVFGGGHASIPATFGGSRPEPVIACVFIFKTPSTTRNAGSGVCTGVFPMSGSSDGRSSYDMERRGFRYRDVLVRVRESDYLEIERIASNKGVSKGYLIQKAIEGIALQDRHLNRTTKPHGLLPGKKEPLHREVFGANGKLLHGLLAVWLILMLAVGTAFMFGWIHF
jgi:hypothetical protein